MTGRNCKKCYKPPTNSGSSLHRDTNLTHLYQIMDAQDLANPVPGTTLEKPPNFSELFSGI